jgi:hypothetical protein
MLREHRVEQRCTHASWNRVMWFTVHMLCDALPSSASSSRPHVLHARLAHTSTNRRVAIAGGKF